MVIPRDVARVKRRLHGVWQGYLVPQLAVHLQLLVLGALRARQPHVYVAFADQDPATTLPALQLLGTHVGEAYELDLDEGEVQLMRCIVEPLDQDSQGEDVVAGDDGGVGKASVDADAW